MSIGDKPHVGILGFIEAREDASEVFDLPEEAFDEMALTIEMFVVISLYFAVFFGGMTA